MRTFRPISAVWVSLTALALTAAPASAQYTWSTTTTDNAWINANNWTIGGNTANNIPGVPGNGSFALGGATSDLAIIGQFAFNPTNGLAIDMSNATGAAGSLSLGAIQFNSTGSNDLQIGNSSTTRAGNLQLNGATVNSVANVLLADTGSRNLTIANAVSGGNQTMGLVLGNTNGVFLINSGRTLTVNTAISEATAGSALTIQGGGTVVLGGTNSYTGATTVTGGSTVSVAADRGFGTAPASATANSIILNNSTLSATNTFTLSANRGLSIGPGSGTGTGTISVASGKTLTYAGAIANNGGTGQLIKTGPGTLVLSGNSTFSGGVIIDGGVLQVPSVSTNTAGAAERLGVVPSVATPDNVIIRNGAVLRNTNTGTSGSFVTANRGITIGTGGGVFDLPDTAAGTQLIYNGTINQGANSLTKTGAAILALSGTITGTGPIFINQGGLRIRGSSERISDSSAVTVASGATFDLSNNGGASGFTETVGSIAGAGNITLGTTGRLISGGDNTSTTFSGLISSAASSTGGMTKNGTGTLTLSGLNTYTGATTINGGVLSVSTLANGGVASGVGQSTNDATNLVINGGTLQYTGAGNSTDRLFALGTGATAGTLDASGTGAVNFTNTGNMGYVNPGDRTLTLAGTNTGANTLAAVINDSGGVTSVTKSGPGTWVLTGNNNYSGPTQVNGGTLLVNGQTGANSGTGTGAVSVASGATLGGNGQVAGAVTVASGGAVQGGRGSAVNEQLTLGNNLTLSNNTTVRAVVNGGTPNDTSLATGSSQVAVTGVLDRSSSTDLITLELLGDPNQFILSGDTLYTRRVMTYGSLGTNLAPGTYQLGSGVFDVTSPTLLLDPGWTVLVGQGGNYVDVQFTPVPEPGTILGVAAAGLGLGGLARRLRRRPAPAAV